MQNDTDLQQLVINKLTKAQYDSATIDDNQLYFVTDGKISADDVDDRTSTNKFVTSSDKSNWNSKSVVSGTNDGTNWNTITIDGITKNIPSGGGSGSSIKRKTLTNSSQNYSLSNNVVTVTDDDVSTDTHVELFPADTTTEQWLESNISSCIITELNGSFSFNITNNLPSTFSMYYLIMEVE